MVVDAGIDGARIGVDAVGVVGAPRRIGRVVTRIGYAFVDRGRIGIVAFLVVFTANVHVYLGKCTDVRGRIARIHSTWIGVDALCRVSTTAGFRSVTAFVVDACVVGTRVAVVALRRCVATQGVGIRDVDAYMATRITHVEGACVSVVALRVQIAAAVDLDVGTDLVDARVCGTDVGIVTIVVDVAVATLVVVAEITGRAVELGATATGLQWSPRADFICPRPGTCVERAT